MSHPFGRIGSAPAAALSLALAAHADPMTCPCQVNASVQLEGQAVANTDAPIRREVDSTNFARQPAVNIAMGVLVDASRNEVAGTGIGIGCLSSIVGSGPRHV